MSRPVSSLLPDPQWSITLPFWEATAREELRFPRCSKCGQFQWYPRILCANCMSPEFSWDQVPPEGSIYTFTIVRRPFLKGVEASLPLAVVQLHFDAAPGVTFITNLHDDDQMDRLAIGASTTLEFEQVTAEMWMPYAAIK